MTAPPAFLLRRVCLPWFAALCFLLVGCATAPGLDPGAYPSANLVLRDAAGRAVLLGEFQFPGGALTPGRNFTGAWRTLAVADFPPVLTPGADAVRYHAEIASQNMSVDLTFGRVDDNVFLVGTESGGVFAGQWYYTTLAGMKTMGDFTLREAAR